MVVYNTEFDLVLAKLLNREYLIDFHIRFTKAVNLDCLANYAVS